jgi:tRNA(fMet)-specific endonuclease VapC
MADGYVLDTDVVSFLFRGDTRASVYEPYLIDTIPVLSFMTIAELDRWALRRDWGELRVRRMEQFLTRFAVALADRAMCRTWASVTDSARRNGRPIQSSDAWIAATALSLDVPLIMNNGRDYRGVDGLVIISNSENS